MNSPASPAAFAAADLGATSGRVVLGRVAPGLLDMTELHRFPNTPIRLSDGLHWDLPALFRAMGVQDSAAARVGSG